MNDTDLLKLAAIAAGLPLSVEWDASTEGILIGQGEGDLKVWNPLADDGEALRLAVDVGLFIELFTEGVFAQEKMGMVTARAFLNDSLASVDIDEPFEAGDPYAATRRAIVRAAAEIGKTRSD